MKTTHSITPHQAPHRMNLEGGFTLLEILVAIFIFAIIITTIFGSHNFIFSNVETFNKDIAIYEMAKNCLNQMVVDLQSIHVAIPPAYAPPDLDSPPDPYRFVGETPSAGIIPFPRLRLTSLSHVSFEKNIQPGIAEIIYYVQPTENANFVLKRSDSLYPYQPFSEKGSDPILCENLKSLTFIYFDAEGTEHEHWNSEDDDFKYATPRAVTIKLELGDNLSSTVFETKVALPVYREEIG
ncbi:prepilin-type N-terminal cleavage/methylation domain-containing protein [Thermodesulfobacteriota bacterium]